MTKILFLVAEDWYFLSHRKPLAEACLKEGWQAVVAANAGAQSGEITAMGCGLEAMNFDRGGLNPFRDFLTFLRILAVLRRHRPDIVHAVGMKPVLYGAIAARLLGVPALVAALGGLGYLFTSGRGRHLSLLRRVLLAGFRFGLAGRRRTLIVQNDDDKNVVLQGNVLPPDRLVLIAGMGADLHHFAEQPFPAAPPVVFACVCRMLRDKGVADLVEVARMLRIRNIPAVIRLVGAADPHNPSSLTEAELDGWRRDGIVEWLGHQSDIPAVWRGAHVAVLPSYREGLPKALLEGMACGRAVITTTATGCRDVIHPGVEGLMVTPGDRDALAEAITTLTRDAELRARMGHLARQRAESHFDQRVIVARHLQIYRQMLDRR